MRVWQKLMLLVLAISVLFVNAGIYAVFQMTYHKNLETEQVRGETAYLVMRKSVIKTMRAMEEQSRLTDAAAADLMALYETDYEKQRVRLKLWKDGRQIYPARGGEAAPDISGGEARIEIGGSRKEKQLSAVSELSGFPDSYELYMEYPLTELNEAWGELYRIYLGVSLGITLVLALALGVMISVLLRPLGKLAEGVTGIRQGEYESRVQVRGADEIAELGRNINAMAETIEDNIKRLRRENESRERLIDNLAHEMKSPLTSIYGFSEYLLKGCVEPEEAAECYSFIMEESRRMQDMCYALMDLSEIRNRETEFELFSAGEWIAELAGLTDKRQKKDLQPLAPVRVSWDNELGDGAVYGNRRLLSMLVMNLVGNAIRACRQREKENFRPEVKILLRRGEKSEQNVAVCVRDEGIGIQEEEIARITEPFYRTDKGRSRESGGNGLGLSLCCQIAEKHGGSLKISSEPGRGTEVTANLWEKFTVL